MLDNRVPLIIDMPELTERDLFFLESLFEERGGEEFVLRKEVEAALDMELAKHIKLGCLSSEMYIKETLLDKAACSGDTIMLQMSDFAMAVAKVVGMTSTATLKARETMPLLEGETIDDYHLRLTLALEFGLFHDGHGTVWAQVRKVRGP